MPRSNKLTDHQAQIIELKKIPGITDYRIAKELGCGISSMRSSHVLALKKLGRVENGEDVQSGPPPELVHPPTEALRDYMGQMADMGPMSDKDAVGELGKIRSAILWHLNNTPEIIANAPLRELVSLANMTIEKMQLLQGEPTAITRFQDIRTLDEVAKMLNAEMKRRGELIDVVAEEV